MSISNTLIRGLNGISLYGAYANYRSRRDAISQNQQNLQQSSILNQYNQRLEADQRLGDQLNQLAGSGFQVRGTAIRAMHQEQAARSANIINTQIATQNQLEQMQFQKKLESRQFGANSFVAALSGGLSVYNEINAAQAKDKEKEFLSAAAPIHARPYGGFF